MGTNSIEAELCPLGLDVTMVQNDMISTGLYNFDLVDVLWHLPYTHGMFPYMWFSLVSLNVEADGGVMTGRQYHIILFWLLFCEFTNKICTLSEEKNNYVYPRSN